VAGLQAYDFVAVDFAKGVQQSTFGEKRMISVENLELVVQIAVSKATVSSTPGNAYQLDILQLQIEIDNLKP
jgi:hypothetical protein